MHHLRMRMALATVVGALVLLTASSPANAIAAFSRKYGAGCNMCHSSYPRLNDFGVKFRNNGYQLPEKEAEEKLVNEGAIPLSARTSLSYNFDRFRNTEGSSDVGTFQINGLDILAGGLISRNTGFFLVYGPQIAGSRDIVAQDGTLEQANIIFSNLRSTWLNVRVGKLEPDYVAFSPARQLTWSPYEIYGFSFPDGMLLGDTQSGIELTGYNKLGCSYALGWLGGGGTDSRDTPADFYLRGAKVFGEGEGLTSGQKIGFMAYMGQAHPNAEGYTTRQGFTRLGLDASLNYRKWNLGMQYIYGSDNKALWNTEGDTHFSGGFIETTYTQSEKWVGIARYDWVQTPAEINQTLTRWTIGGRYYIKDNLALHLEASHRVQAQALLPAATEKFFTFGLDAAF